MADPTTLEAAKASLSPRDAQMLKLAEDTAASNRAASQAEVAARNAVADHAKAATAKPADPAKALEQQAQAEGQKLADAAKPTDALNPDGTIKASEEAKILGKFKTQADLEKAYTELEAKMSGKPPAEGEAKAPLVTTAEMTEYAATVTANGDLTAEHYAELNKRGLSPEIVKGYVHGLKAAAAEHLQQTYAVAGGKEGYEKMSAWASKSVPAAELAVFNADVRSGDKARVSSAVTGLYSRYVAAGNSPNTPAVQQRTSGSTSQAASGVRPITSTTELADLMSSYEYKNNINGFRDATIARLAASQGL